VGFAEVTFVSTPAAATAAAELPEFGKKWAGISVQVR